MSGFSLSVFGCHCIGGEGGREKCGSVVELTREK